jgi:hypothetical protein
MALPTSIVLKARVNGSIGGTIANAKEVYNVDSRTLMLGMLSLYEFLVKEFHRGIRFSARSKDGRYVPNLLLIEWPEPEDSYVDLTMRMSQHRRNRWQRVGRLTSTDDIGDVIQKAHIIYRNWQAMQQEEWTFFATSITGQEEPIEF